MENNINETDDLVGQINSILSSSDEIKKQFHLKIEKAHPAFKKSIDNLLDYISLRNVDIRVLQERLSELGLSSLGRSESHVKANLIAVRNILMNVSRFEKGPNDASISYNESKEILKKNTFELLGPIPYGRTARIMVSLPSEAAVDYQLVRKLLESGMECARINCAHDNQEAWAIMIKNIKKASAETGKPCKILMDIAGPKLRTGPLKPGPNILELKPEKDAFGNVTQPITVFLTTLENKLFDKLNPTLLVDSSWLSVLEKGNFISFKDRREKKRTMEVIDKTIEGCYAHLYKTSYIETGAILKFKKTETVTLQSLIGELPSMEAPIILKIGDILILHKANTPGEPAQYDTDGKLTKPAHTSCTYPSMINQLKQNEPILFDDGKIEGKIISVSEKDVRIEITYAKENGSKLRAAKGINLPDSSLKISGLTDKDREDLKFVAKNADIVNMSFVNSAEDLFALHKELKKLKAIHLGIMVKIETKRGFKNLPLILLAAMQTYPVGVMIARGDLGVEVGWKRLAEIQEEMLWMCEAAHVPVVWATQVLENLAQKGLPSRAEITDAAMSQRAECVMLNKGPYIIKAVEMLDDILRTMEGNQYKKTPMLRHLNISDIIFQYTS